MFADSFCLSLQLQVLHFQVCCIHSILYIFLSVIITYFFIHFSLCYLIGKTVDSWAMGRQCSYRGVCHWQKACCIILEVWVSFELKPTGHTLTAFYWDALAVKSVESSKVCKVRKVLKRHVQIFPRTSRDYNQLLLICLILVLRLLLNLRITLVH